MPYAAPALDVRPMTRLFKALGEETRLRMVALLAHGELCVCHIEAALGLTQTTASRHLSVLRAAGVVEPRRNGNWVYYRLAPQPDDDCRRQLKSLTGAFAKNDVLGRDVERLLQAKGPLACR